MRRKRAITILLAAAKVFALIAPMALAKEYDAIESMSTERHGFTDVRATAWYDDAVQFVFQNAVMQGVDARIFNPQGQLTRAEVTALVFRLEMGRAANSYDSRANHFTDVKQEWFAPYVTWAFHNNIVTGTGPATFHPDGEITRQEFAAILYRYAMSDFTALRDTGGQSGQWPKFTDRGQISDWAYTALRWMNYHGIVTGSSATTMSPTGTATRAEAAMMLWRFMRLLGVGNHVLPERPPQDSPFVAYWLENLTLEEKIGQLIMPRLPWRTTSTATIGPWLDAIPFGGFILFADNVQSMGQLQRLTADLQARARLPLLISTDEEGGRVSRVGSLFGGATPSAFAIGQAGDPLWAYEVGQTNAQRLLQLGINMNFAPVADVWSNPANRVIGNRAFGHTAEVASPAVAATVEGLQDKGVFATLKHFPGHGDTYEDSHHQLAFHRHGIDRFWEVEALPFISGIEAGAAAVMTGHIATPNAGNPTALLPWMQPWINKGSLPATFSDFWLQDILRGELGFEGLIITDGLEMRALTDHFSCRQIALGAFLAGADILLIPANPAEAFQALLEGYHNGYFTQERLDESLRRILEAKESLQ